MQREAFGFDRARAVIDARGDMNLIARPLCGAGHRQAVEEEGPILVDDIEQSSRGLDVSGVHSLEFPESRPDWPISGE